jgi:hypothetical protein
MFEAFRRPKPYPIENWVKQSAPELIAALANHLKAVGSKDPVGFDSNKLLLSEMGLCGAIHESILPKGYRPVSGVVYLNGGMIPFKHEFAVSGNDILCITPGQFIEPGDNSLEKGDRIKMLMNRNPRHIMVDGELAVLFGKIRDIDKSYGLLYATR